VSERAASGEDGESVLSRHAQLVCDRVEIFVPVVFERFRPQIEARYAPVVEGEGTLVLDAVPFHLGRPDRGPGGGRVFSLFAALAATPKGASLVRWPPFHGEHGRCGSEWERFLGSLPGAPARLLCDLDDDILPAVERPWPQTERFVAEARKLLMLLHLHIDGYANERAYSAAIRDWLLSNGGRPRVARRAITDPHRAPSLRAPH
jgi:hypothetical protein